jgi:hypothetical protein
MLRPFAFTSLAMVGLVALAAALAEAGRRTGSWRYVNPNSAYAMAPYSHPQPQFGGYAGPAMGRHWGHRGYPDYAPSPHGHAYGHRRYGPAW